MRLGSLPHRIGLYEIDEMEEHRIWREDSTFLRNWNAFPYERFPALAGCKFRVVTTNAVLDDTGRMIDFTPVLRTRRPAILDDDSFLEAALLEEIKKRLLSCYRIGDEYTPGRLDGAIRPFELSFPKE